jgi:hypothetical protein
MHFKMTAATLYDGRVLVCGIHLAFHDQPTSCLYDPLSNKWTVGPDMGNVRDWYKLLSFKNGREIIVVGERNDAYVEPETYDVDNNKWMLASETPSTYANKHRIPRDRGEHLGRDMFFEDAD